MPNYRVSAVVIGRNHSVEVDKMVAEYPHLQKILQMAFTSGRLDIRDLALPQTTKAARLLGEIMYGPIEGQDDDTKIRFSVRQVSIGRHDLTLNVLSQKHPALKDLITLAGVDNAVIVINFLHVPPTEEAAHLLAELVWLDPEKVRSAAAPGLTEKQTENLCKPVDELELMVRSANCLQNANVRYIHQLVRKTEPEMLRTKNFGRKSLNEVKEILADMELGFAMTLPDEYDWPTE